MHRFAVDGILRLHVQPDLAKLVCEQPRIRAGNELPSLDHIDRGGPVHVSLERTRVYVIAKAWYGNQCSDDAGTKLSRSDGRASHPGLFRDGLPIPQLGAGGRRSWHRGVDA
jgi:hypothetical protein